MVLDRPIARKINTRHPFKFHGTFSFVLSGLPLPPYPSQFCRFVTYEVPPYPNHNYLVPDRVPNTTTEETRTLDDLRFGDVNWRKGARDKHRRSPESCSKNPLPQWTDATNTTNLRIKERQLNLCIFILFVWCTKIRIKKKGPLFDLTSRPTNLTAYITNFGCIKYDRQPFYRPSREANITNFRHFEEREDQCFYKRKTNWLKLRVNNMMNKSNL